MIKVINDKVTFNIEREKWFYTALLTCSGERRILAGAVGLSGDRPWSLASAAAYHRTELIDQCIDKWEQDDNTRCKN